VHQPPDEWARVRQVFDGALAVPSEARDGYLTDACGADQALRQQVELLLASHDRAGSFLETPPGPSSDAGAHVPQIAGQRIGAYEVVSRLGAGGMGEVYLARDLKLGREVAIKVLPHRFTRDPERLARFEREARVLAALNHPNVGAIYGVEDPAPGSSAVATRALVLELVEGDTLAERIALGTRDSGSGGRGTTESRVPTHKTRRGLPVAEALRVAEQIAGALQAAHDKGIIHRDLKPANVKITPAGMVKVLDFGLAKAALGDAGSSPDLSHSPTMTIGGTEAGMILGTAAYMSPEQARGHVVDKRTDIWAFGCVLYEMLAGRVAFAGATVSDTIAAILEREPEWSALPRATPAKIRDLLRRCLQKDPNRRLHDIADARIEIEDVRAPQAHPVSPHAWKIIGATATLALAVAVFLWLRADRRPRPTSSEWVQITNFQDSATQPALSPDGRMLTFIRGAGTFTTQGQIYVKQLPDGEPVPLTHDNLVKMSPVFSPDSARVAYTVNADASAWNTWAVAALRGEPRLWLRNAAGLTWIGKDQVLFSEIKQGRHMAIVSSPQDRTEARDVYVPENGSGMAHRSYVSPDKKTVLVVEMDESGVWMPCRLVPFEPGSAGRTVGPLDARCTDAAWAPDGTFMYFSADRGDGFHLWRQRVPEGQPEQITSSVTQEEGLAIAPDGRSLITSVGLRRRAIFVRDATGDERQVSVEGYAYFPLLSMDGQKICYRVSRSVGTGQSPTELWMTELATGHSERVLATQLVTSYDVSRDDRIIAAVREPDGKSTLWLAWLDGREQPRRIPGVEGDNPRFGRRGEIVFRATDGSSSFLFRVNEDGTARQQLSSNRLASGTAVGSVSPDGEWVSAMAAGSRPGESPRSAPDAPGVMTAFSTSGADPVGVFPNASTSRLRWAPDGKRVYLSIQFGDASSFANGRTYGLPLESGSMLPRIPDGGFRSEAELAAVPGVQILPHGDFAPGPSPSVYAFSRETVTRNLYRIPLP
jgi:serine/threonine protein kinase/Tol biopolymer transport system component